MAQFVETAQLRPVGIVRLPARRNPFEAEKFYNKHMANGVYVWNSFAPKVLDGYMSPKTTPERSYAVLEVKTDETYDTEIARALLSRTYLSRLEDIASTVEACRNGQETYLLPDGHANIFYVKGSLAEVLVLSLYWNTQRTRWTIRVYPFTETGCWYRGDRIFFPEA